jgi:hypothetical protein
MKQTAIEWLYYQLNDYDFTDLKNNDYYEFKIPVYVLKEKIEQAKEMEFQQIVNAYNQGVTDEYGETLDFTNDTDAEEYYNKNYGQ